MNIRKAASTRNCLNGSRCRNPRKDADGGLSPDEFQKGKTQDGLRNNCAFCHSYYDTTPQGAKEEWLYRNGGIDIPPSGHVLDKTPYFTTLEVAVRWGISTTAVRTLHDEKKTNFPLRAWGDADESKKGEHNEHWFKTFIVEEYERRCGDLIENQRINGQEQYEKLMEEILVEESTNDEFHQQSLVMPDSHPENDTDILRACAIIRSLCAVTRLSYTLPALQLNFPIDDLIKAFAPKAVSDALDVADKFLSMYTTEDETE